MLEAFAKVTRKLLGLDREIETSPEAKAEFYLLYDGIKIGILSVDDGVWTFRYTDEFRRHPELRPIVEFPDVNDTYRSVSLWPFFQMRIPSRTQEEVGEIMRQEHIQENDEVELLKRFGKRTIANPYELIAA